MAKKKAGRKKVAETSTVSTNGTSYTKHEKNVTVLPDPDPPGAQGAVSVEVPVAEVGGNVFLQARIDLKPGYQRAGFCRLFRGLEKEGALMLDGRPVSTPGHAVAWILEQVGQLSEKECGAVKPRYGPAERQK